MATQMPPFHRTQGDGMERVESSEPVEHTVVLQPQEFKETCDLVRATTAAVKCPRTQSRPMDQFGSAIKLTPQTVKKTTKNVLGHLKNKEPKFVPYEPYKAAVRPIVPQTRGKNVFRKGGEKGSGEGQEGDAGKDREIAASASRKGETGDGGSQQQEQPKKTKKTTEEIWQAKLKVLEGEMQVMREENEQLEKQLKFQVQVNGELKNLLVAAVGEDMETKVHVLTEDKLHLAQALLKSAESLTSHREQTEWLAGQCEVWRSKFLASSVMVEELARWKASLCQKVTEANEALRRFLDEGKEIRERIGRTHENLSRLRDNFDLRNRKSRVTDSTVIETCEETVKMSEALVLELLGSTDVGQIRSTGSYRWKKTAAEKSAERILANPGLLQLIGEPDAACNAVVGAAVNLSGQLYLQSHPPKIECCRQCTGEIKLV